MITVTTADQRFAGTDAGVSVALHGTLADSPAVMLEPDSLSEGAGQARQLRDLFARGSSHSFHIRCEDVGSLEAVTLSHDASGAAPSWLPDAVQVQRVQSSQQWHFACQQWLGPLAEDGSCSRRIAVSQSNKMLPSAQACILASDSSCGGILAQAEKQCLPPCNSVHSVRVTIAFIRRML